MSILAFGSVDTDKGGDSTSSRAEDHSDEPTSKLSSSDNLANKVAILNVATTWAPSKTNPRGVNLLWVQPTIRNNSQSPIATIYAKLTMKDSNGNVLISVDEIIYYSVDVGSKLAPGRTYSGDPYMVGDPFPVLLPDGTFMTSGKVSVDVDVQSAWEDPNIDSKGNRVTD
jgi:hypothetical protein